MPCAGRLHSARPSSSLPPQLGLSAVWLVVCGAGHSSRPGFDFGLTKQPRACAGPLPCVLARADSSRARPAAGPPLLQMSINFLVSLLKKNWQNVKSLYIKSSMGKPYRLY